MGDMPHFFGIRHLSPAGAYYVREYLSQKAPKLVLIEGPSDFTDVMSDMVNEKTKPPVAILAYTKELPVRTVLYPFAEYSPEYQAILWCHQNNVRCEFFDLPSETFLAFSHAGFDEKMGEEGRIAVYQRLDEVAQGDGHETFWERTMEHVLDSRAYHAGANLFGAQLRELTQGADYDWPETVVREAYMRSYIRKAVNSGIKAEDIVVITGSYHVEGLKNWAEDEYIGELPAKETLHTLMPYSYYMLSIRSGYGAGNKAPAYYSLLWEGLNRGDRRYAANAYLSKIAEYQRENGNPVSTASVIEAVRLADSLAELRGGVPTLYDLRDAALTCLGEGSFSSISLATADTEIGTLLGELPEGVSRTSIQEDFYRCLNKLKLEKYKSITSQNIELDLRENRRVKSEEAAFLDLHRSTFLHQLRILNIGFAVFQAVNKDDSTWAELWMARWSTEAEIALVEAALKGDTVRLAAAYEIKEKISAATSISQISEQIENSFLCGMEEMVEYATRALQALAVDAASIEEIANCMEHLSIVISYGSIRRINSKPLEPILQQLFYHCCLILPGECVCDDAASKTIISAVEKINRAVQIHDFLMEEQWRATLQTITFRDDLNTKVSGFCASILLEQGNMDSAQLNVEVKRRLSKGVPADLGAGWFEGLAMKNHYSLITRLSVWTSIDGYLEELDDEEFKKALVFLRRAFADFSAYEKDQIAENLGESWGLNGAEVSEAVNVVLDEKAQELVDGLADFDFDF